MKIKKIKLMVGALVIAMIGATLTGCGGNKEENAGAETQTTISISGST